jgi:Fe-S-cluster containining protein
MTMNDVPKFVFNCTDCGKCCERDVTIYLEDISDWMEYGLMYKVLPHLSIEGEYVSLSIQLDKQSPDDRSVCALYDIEKQECTLLDNKPISCRSYPLGYNGKNFIVVDKNCPGLGNGEMTAEKLASMRETAKAEFTSKQETLKLFPMLHAMFIKKFTIESQKAMDELSPEQKEELEKILSEKKE